MRLARMVGGIAIALGLIASASVARADSAHAATPSHSSLVPVISDDQADWQRARPPAYFAVGSSVSKDVQTNVVVFVEGAMRVATTPIWVHGLIGTGAEKLIQDQGQFVEARGGVELSCVQRRVVCGFFGIDVGGQMESRKGGVDTDDMRGVVAVPRMGIDLGGDIVRIRATVDGRWFRYHNGNSDELGTTAGGAGVSLALALRF
jgi:hypothetical protein